MKKSPFEIALEAVSWVFLLPRRISQNSDKKSIRVIGMLATFPYAMLAIPIMGVPIAILLCVSIILELCYDA